VMQQPLSVVEWRKSRGVGTLSVRAASPSPPFGGRGGGASPQADAAMTLRPPFAECGGRALNPAIFVG
jgi:hypothetical protein